MKTLGLSALLAASVVAQEIPPPGVIVNIDFNKDGVDDLTYGIMLESAGPTTTQVDYYVYASGQTQFLGPAKKKQYFLEDSIIDGTLPTYNPGTVFGIHSYFANNDPGGWLFSYANIPNTLNAATEGIVGVRLQLDDGVHVGWVRFTRPDTEVRTPFAVADWDWNPISGAPIGAGLPPEIPLTTEVADDGSGQAVLRVSWNPGVADWIFETTTDLTPPVTWTSYPAGGTSADVPLEGEDAQRYFRLRHP